MTHVKVMCDRLLTRKIIQWRFKREKLLRIREVGDFFLGLRNALLHVLTTYNNRNMTQIKYLCNRISAKKMLCLFEQKKEKSNTDRSDDSKKNNSNNLTT